MIVCDGWRTCGVDVFVYIVVVIVFVGVGDVVQFGVVVVDRSIGGSSLIEILI